jgi:HD domain-containing protein
MSLAEPARTLARSVLAEELPRRWAHSRGVADQATQVGTATRIDGDLLEAAAWLHDIGYASALNVVGFHPIDGARYLRDNGFGDRPLWTLVAHHTCAPIEAGLRGLTGILAEEFPADAVDTLVLEALTYCDMTTSPDGHRIDVEERIAEILTRYGPDDLVHQAISEAAPLLRRQTETVRTLLGEG